MYYASTRNKNTKLTAAQAIARGLASDGGLYVPSELPQVSMDDLIALSKLCYRERANRIMSLFLDGFSKEEIDGYTKKAYGKNFDCDAIAPVKKLDGRTHFLELWHGPTCAFKDMALQMLPYLMTASMKKTGENRQVCILTATSGDTGKAALEGFRDVPGTKIMVFYPVNGVSEVQKLQMTSQEGGNVEVAAVNGNFDDAQSGVKAIFSDEAIREKIDKAGWFLSSANSINWGRLLPQIVYYFSAYCDLMTSGEIKAGDKINFCVPTGNFGDILAGYYAMCMGLPVNRLICASNSNDVLTNFISTGVYNKKRPFYTTVSPSMDILVSSNLERLLYHMSGNDSGFTADCMQKLGSEGEYSIPDKMLKAIQNVFSCGSCSEAKTEEAVKKAFDTYGYLIDTHTAVAYSVLEDYRHETGDDTVSVVVSTASPFKFCGAVLTALDGKTDADGIAAADALSARTKACVPVPIAALKNKTPRFTKCVEKEAMPEAVLDFVKKTAWAKTE